MVTDFRSQKACLGEEGCFFWKAPRQAWGESKLRGAQGGPCQTPTPGQCLSPHVEGKTHELVFAAEQIFLLPTSKPESVSSPASSSGLQSNGLELWVEVSSATLTRWDRSGDCWAQVIGHRRRSVSLFWASSPG